MMVKQNGTWGKICFITLKKETQGSKLRCILWFLLLLASPCQNQKIGHRFITFLNRIWIYRPYLHVHKSRLEYHISTMIPHWWISLHLQICGHEGPITSSMQLTQLFARVNAQAPNKNYPKSQTEHNSSILLYLNSTVFARVCIILICFVFACVCIVLLAHLL